MPEIKIELNNYKNLLNLARKDQDRLYDLIKGMLNLIDTHYKTVEEATGMKAENFLLETILAFTDYEGIVNNHPNPSEAKLMKMLKHENNPIRAMQDSSVAMYDTEGNAIPKKEFFSTERYKEWIQELLYMGRYVDHKRLAEYLSLGEFHLLDNLQNEHIKQLLDIQPALNYQKGNNLTVGKLKEGTGFFYCGSTPKDHMCLACEEQENVMVSDNDLYCLACKAVFNIDVS